MKAEPGRKGRLLPEGLGKSAAFEARREENKGLRGRS